LEEKAMTKIITWLLATVLLTTGSIAEAQPVKKIPQLGYLRQGTRASTAAENEAFWQGLHELGYIEGKNIQTEYRFADGKVDRVPDLVAELVRLKVDVLVVGGNRAARAAKEATSTIPVVVGSAEDLVRGEIVASLAKPGGNITGSTGIAPDLSGKRLEVLKEVLPKALTVAVLSYTGSGKDTEFLETEAAARQMGTKLQRILLRHPSEFQTAFLDIVKHQAHAIIIIQSAFTLTHRIELAEFAAKHRLPSMCEQAAWTYDGCLMSYGRNQLAQWRRAAYFVDKILKGVKPADLPVEQPMKFELVINLKTANQIGVTIPPNVLARADRVVK
jgi:putative tryptophan/tyrosine transport system substrate-binding protein